MFSLNGHWKKFQANLNKKRVKKQNETLNLEVPYSSFNFEFNLSMKHNKICFLHASKLCIHIKYILIEKLYFKNYHLVPILAPM